MADDVDFDWHREGRTGLPEAVYCPGKTPAQLATLITQARQRQRALLLTRLTRQQLDGLTGNQVDGLAFDPVSATAIANGDYQQAPRPSPIAVVSAGTSDLPVAQEACRTLRFLGHEPTSCQDCGVAGLWRLRQHETRLRACRVIIAVAGMEGALFSVIAGLFPALIIAVPTATGYGVAADGVAALHSALATCSPGVVTVNIGNGFGAACAAAKVLDGNASTTTRAER